MAKILVVEDEKEIAELIALHLKDEFHDVNLIHDGKIGFDESLQGEYDLVVLDIMLPNMNGLDICRNLRNQNKYMPILMLTSKSEEFDKVVGLEAGADDYLTKPFSIHELKARIKALLRRQEMNRTPQIEEPSEIVQFSHLSIDFGKRKAQLNEERVDLTPKEFELLSLLAKYPGRTFTRLELLSKVWGVEFEGMEYTVNTHINRLRSKIEADTHNPTYILTTWGLGYRFNDEL